MTKTVKISLTALGAVLIVVCLYAIRQLSLSSTVESATNTINRNDKVSSEQAQGSIIPVLNRKYLDSALSFVRAFEVPINVLYLQHSNGNVYCADLQSISCFDSTGSLQHVYGKAGRGPGELAMIASFAFDNQHITIVDMGSMSSVRFSYSGALVKSFRFNAAFRRGAWCGQEKYLLVPQHGGTMEKEEFVLFDAHTGNSQQIFVPRFKASSHSVPYARAMELDGSIINPGYGTVFRVSSFAGEFIAFDTNGNVKYHRQTIDKTPLPVVKTTATGDNVTATYDMEKSRLVNTSATADSKYLYIASNAKTPDITFGAAGINTITVVDMYNVHTGSYVASMRIPTYSKSIAGGYPALIAIAPKGLYVYEGMSVRYYSLQLPKEYGL